MPNRKSAIFAVAASVLCLAACSTNAPDQREPEKITETVTTTEKASSSAKSPESSSASETQTKSSKATSTTKDSRPTGYTEAPTGDPTPINKSISHCATSSQGLYEQGTTWFADGTSGWTQYCSDNFYDGPPPSYSEPGYAPETQEAPAGQNNEPSPWVQGQIDWTNCLNSGNTEEQCRSMLN